MCVAPCLDAAHWPQRSAIARDFGVYRRWTSLCKMLYKMKKVARIPVSEARKNFANLLELAASGTRVKVTRYNQTLGGIISSEDLLSLKNCEDARVNTNLPARKRKQNEKHAKTTRTR